MLVLTGKQGNEIQILTQSGEEIIVKFCGGKSGRTRLGFIANKSIRIMRMEVLEGRDQSGNEDRDRSVNESKNNLNKEKVDEHS